MRAAQKSRGQPDSLLTTTLRYMTGARPYPHNQVGCRNGGAWYKDYEMIGGQHRWATRAVCGDPYAEQPPSRTFRGRKRQRSVFWARQATSTAGAWPRKCVLTVVWCCE